MWINFPRGRLGAQRAALWRPHPVPWEILEYYNSNACKRTSYQWLLNPLGWKTPEATCQDQCISPGNGSFTLTQKTLCTIVGCLMSKSEPHVKNPNSFRIIFIHIYFPWLEQETALESQTPVGFRITDWISQERDFEVEPRSGIFIKECSWNQHLSETEERSRTGQRGELRNNIFLTKAPADFLGTCGGKVAFLSHLKLGQEVQPGFFID